MDTLTPTPPSDTILCVNVGSSSIKAALFACSSTGEPVALSAATQPASPEALDRLMTTVVGGDGAPSVVAHRVVHGGPNLVEHAIVDSVVRSELDAAVPFAPLHLPAELAALDAATLRFPAATQVACFDTAFHRTMSDVARRLALPGWVNDEGVERFGFHGLSYEFVVHDLGADLLGRAVVAHLGSGASLAAIAGGRSVDTTMGLTPTGGVVMATRSGDLDPGVLIYLARRHTLDVEGLERLTNHESGLLGVSGVSGDMRTLLNRSAGSQDCALAVDVFCHSVRKAIGALAAALGGLDSLVFTGGIGEHVPEIRQHACEGLAHLGVSVDSDRNEQDEAVISDPGGAVTVRVVRTDENLMIARHAAHLCAA